MKTISNLDFLLEIKNKKIILDIEKCFDQKTEPLFPIGLVRLILDDKMEDFCTGRL